MAKGAAITRQTKPSNAITTRAAATSMTAHNDTRRTLSESSARVIAIDEYRIQAKEKRYADKQSPAILIEHVDAKHCEHDRENCSDENSKSRAADFTLR